MRQTMIATVIAISILMSGVVSSIAGVEEVTGVGVTAGADGPVLVDGKSKIKHLAIKKKVSASSTHMGMEGEGTAEAMIDGDLTTRWSSEYKSPQEVVVDLQEVVAVKMIRLFWERASATQYRVSVSNDGKEWKNVHLAFMRVKDIPTSRVDDISLKGAKIRMIKLSLLGRVDPDWGFSLYEIAVIGRE